MSGMIFFFGGETSKYLPAISAAVNGIPSLKANKLQESIVIYIYICDKPIPEICVNISIDDVYL